MTKRRKRLIKNQKKQDDEKNSNACRRQLRIFFSEYSERNKRRKAEELRANVSSKGLLYLATSKLRCEGNNGFSKVVHDISEGSPTKASTYRISL